MFFWIKAFYFALQAKRYARRFSHAVEDVTYYQRKSQRYLKRAKAVLKK